MPLQPWEFCNWLCILHSLDSSTHRSSHARSSLGRFTVAASTFHMVALIDPRGGAVEVVAVEEHDEKRGICRQHHGRALGTRRRRAPRDCATAPFGRPATSHSFGAAASVSRALRARNVIILRHAAWRSDAVRPDPEAVGSGNTVDTVGLALPTNLPSAPVGLMRTLHPGVERP
jgi:hypothetical protein